MEFQFESWPVKKLLDLYKAGNLNLKPSYQRNSVWSFNTQKALIDSLKGHSALPAFFLLKKEDGKFEVVDGQQRSSTLLLYNDTTELDDKGSLEQFKKKGFLTYPLNITVITKLAPHEKIEDFYTTINSSGTSLNRPEKFKARFSETKFLDLVERFTDRQEFINLNLVPDSSKKRMIDRDLVEEVVALSVYKNAGKKEPGESKGKNYDKKDFVETIYKRDLLDNEIEFISESFDLALKVFGWFNKIKPIRSTRYRQRNDFFTLYGFILDNPSLSKGLFERFYNTLLAVEPGIKPDKNGCPPLYEYALNCVSQSNSKSARDTRSRIIEQIFAGPSDGKNEVHDKILKYYAIPKSGIEVVDGCKRLVPSVVLPQVLKKESI